MIPRLSSNFGNGVPSADDWRIVSSNMITPLMNSSAPSVVKSRSRYARRFSSDDSTPIESKRFLIVPSLSSAARIPLPGATRARAISSRVCVSAMVAMSVLPRSRQPRLCPLAGTQYLAPLAIEEEAARQAPRRTSRLDDNAMVERNADVAQLVEHQLPKLRVAGSNPVVRSHLPWLASGFASLGVPVACR